MNDRVTACDIAHVPLENNYPDVAIFSLALMGTNYVDFLRRLTDFEAWGLLLIGRVESRFVHEPTPRSRKAGIKAFTKTLQKLGFERNIVMPRTVFLMFDFVKSASRKPRPALSLADIFVLKSCRYKRR